MIRRDREDLSSQQQRVAEARSELADKLDDLATEASLTATQVKRAKRGNITLHDVYAFARAVERAEEALDLALLDLATAAGADA